MRTIDLSGDWTLVRQKNGRRYSARVPGDTHSALLAAGAIPDPYVGANELDVQWVGREDWAYERSFSLDAGWLGEEMAWLRCDSLDTIAEVSVNGAVVGRSDNMFVRRQFDVRGALRRGRNTVRILLRSAEAEAARRAARLPYPIPHTVNPVQSPHRNLVRKVQCHSGWDWGPCLMVAGIPRGISLGATSGVRIDYVTTSQRHARQRCRVGVTVECTAARAGDYVLEVTLDGTTVRRNVALEAGPGTVEAAVVLDRPRRWWPAGSGPQPLYDLEVALGGDRVRKRLGLRTIELANREDRGGLSMVFRVNGVDLFCKGANWIPSDALPQRQTPAQIRHLLESAVAANMNMLRIWGGGQYESDAFYDLCDELGLLVWQDLMFSCALYPATAEFLASVEEEVRHQAKRLRDHPSLALWCGNNEDVGALSWFEVSRRNRDRYLVDYDRLTEGTIGRTLDACDPTRPFWPSSPSAGRNDYSDCWHQDNRGDMHYWNVWHEGAPFSAFYDVKPRFCSEFGYQSFPSLETIRTFAEESALNPTAPVMEHHQRHPRGNAIITEMFTRSFRVPEGFRSFVYLSQVQQALAIRTAVEYWRTLRPYCMGTLFWQLDDTWPVCSWSSIEYGGRWKLLHYAARRFYAPVLATARVRDGVVEAWVANDLREPVSGRLEAELFAFDGTRLRRERLAARVPGASARRLRRWPVDRLAPRPDRCFLMVSFEHAGGVSSGELFFTEYKRCELAAAEVRAEVRAVAGRLRIELSTDRPAFFVTLEAEGIAGAFEDNCFTLLPGRPRTIGFAPRSRATLAGLRTALRVTHLRETYR